MKLFVVSMLAFIATSVVAMTPNPNPYDVTVDDGTIVTLRMVGSEENHVEETLDGFTVGLVDGSYFYLKQGQNGNLVSTRQRVGRGGPPPNVGKHQRRSQSAWERDCRNKGLKCTTLPSQALHSLRAETKEGEKNPQGGGSRRLLTGTLKNLVVVFKFSDHGSRNVPSPAEVDTLMNNVGPDALCPTGSVRDVFLENSYGALTVDSVVAPWFTIDYTEAQCANGDSGLTWFTHTCLRDALNKVDDLINFSEFDVDGDGYIDGITFLHSGYGAEWGGTDSYGTNYVDRMWSHKWAIGGNVWTSQENVRVYNYHISPSVWGTSGSNIGRIGVIAHETGHYLSMPDMYDTDNSPGNGIGSWELMANSWGFDGSQHYPPLMSAWTKIALGWTSATVISSGGTFMVDEACGNVDAVYRIDHNFPSGEYVLIENRQPCSFDGAMPQGGLAIWHVDETSDHNTEGYPGQPGWPGNGNHYKVALLQADGNYNLEKGNNGGDGGDVYHAGAVDNIGPGGGHPNTDAYQGGNIYQTDIEISAISASSSTMSFTVALFLCTIDDDCDDQDICTEDQCIGGSCTNTPTVPPACDDALLCTEDTCANNQCVNTQTVCTPSDSCQTGSCNNVTGQCEFVPEVPCCGNGQCELDEDCTSCPEDCGPPVTVGGTVCGNGVCEDTEDCRTCSADCNGRTTGNPNQRYCCDGGPLPVTTTNGVDCNDRKCTTNGKSCDTSQAPPEETTCCGDLTCDSRTENVANCFVDCGAPTFSPAPTLAPVTPAPATPAPDNCVPSGVNPGSGCTPSTNCCSGLGNCSGGKKGTRTCL